MSIPTERDVARFESKVDRSGCCHIWTASTNHKGYGKFGLGGRGKGWQVAHRVAWVIRNGPIPDDLCVLHRCDNPLCVNVDHLFLGDRAANNLDMHEKDRHSLHNAKLTARQVEEIRRRRKDGVTMARLARDLGVSQTTIRNVVHGHTYRSPRTSRAN